jgi:hypothetical protein
MATARGRPATPAERANREAFRRARPRQFGNLHERLKYLLQCARKCGLHRLDNDTWQAIWDAITEAALYSAPKRSLSGQIVWRSGDPEARRWLA